MKSGKLSKRLQASKTCQIGASMIAVTVIGPVESTFPYRSYSSGWPYRREPRDTGGQVELGLPRCGTTTFRGFTGRDEKLQAGHGIIGRGQRLQVYAISASFGKWKARKSGSRWHSS